MTPKGGRLSENEKVLWMCFLFPLFWPFIPAVLVCMAVEAVRDAFWRWRHKRAAFRAATEQARAAQLAALDETTAK